VRARYGIATSTQVDVPPVSDKAMLVMVHRLDSGVTQVTVLNFASHPVRGTVTSEHLPPGSKVIDMFTDQVLTEVDKACSFGVRLRPYQGMALMIGMAT
jgi:hypothetical protein